MVAPPARPQPAAHGLRGMTAKVAGTINLDDLSRAPFIKLQVAAPLVQCNIYSFG